MELFDPISPKGHENFNKDVEKYYNLRIKYFKKTSEKRGLIMLINHFKSIRNKSDVLLISFDNLIMFLMIPFILFKRHKVFCIVHNNLEYVSTNKIHFFLLKYISKHISLIFLTDYIYSHSNDYKIFGTVQDFQLILYKKNNIKFYDGPNLKNAFVHGRLNQEDLKYIENLKWVNYDNVYCNNPNLVVSFENWVCQFIYNFDEILISCKDFYFLKKKNFRQYSVLFKILNISNINLYILDEALFNYAKKIIREYDLKVNIILVEKNIS